MIPWTSISTLATVAALLSCRVGGVELAIKDFPWWGIPLLGIGCLVAPFLGFLWLGALGEESRESKAAQWCQGVAVVLFLAMLVLL